MAKARVVWLNCRATTAAERRVEYNIFVLGFSVLMDSDMVNFYSCLTKGSVSAERMAG